VRKPVNYEKYIGEQHKQNKSDRLAKQPVIMIGDRHRYIEDRESASRQHVNYEKYIGENLFGKIGILILVLGMGLFVKYAIDKEWINESDRHRYIEDRESASRQQRAKGTIGILQTPSHE